MSRSFSTSGARSIPFRGLRPDLLLGLTVLAALGPACRSYEDDAGTRACFDPLAGEFFDFPFPSDHLRTSQGTIAIPSFPRGPDLSVVDQYRAYARQALDGFGTSAALYVHFTGPLDRGRLPAPAESARADSPVQLINVDPVSPRYGQRAFLLVDYFDQASDYWPADTLAVLPYPGLVLDERTTYALVVRRDLGDATGQRLGAPGLLKRALAGAHLDAGADDATRNAVVDSLAPLRAYLDQTADGLEADDVAVATVFTTQAVREPLARVRAFLQTQDVPPLLALRHVPEADGDSLWVFEGAYQAPNFQQGNLPYLSAGGDFAFDAAGTPQIAFVEQIAFWLAVPNRVAPAAGWPVVIFSHGVQQDRTALADDDTLAPARVLTARGLAVIGIDAPLHGLRDQGLSYDLGLATFNFFNPASFRYVFQQAAADLFVLARALAAGAFAVPAAVSPDGQAITLRTDPLLSLGFSFGAISSAIAVGSEPRLRASAHFAGGGFLPAMASLQPTTASLLRLVLSIPPQSPISLHHPVLAVIQTVVEPIDAANHAPAFIDRAGAGVVHDVLLAMGSEDDVIPPPMGDALATAAGCAPLAQHGWPVEGLRLRDLLPLTPPITGNRATPAGVAATCVYAQYGEESARQGHGLMWQDPTAAARYTGFFESLLATGQATLPALP